MRILKVTRDYYPFLEKGGPAVKVRALAEWLAARGNAVTVLTAAHDGSRAGTAQLGGVEVLYLRSRWVYRSAGFHQGLVDFCRTRLGAYEVAHIYGLYDLLGPTVAYYCRRQGIPYVLEPMGMLRPIVRSLFSKRIYHRLLGQALVRGAKRVIATSQQEHRELLEEELPSGQLCIRRNGIDLAEFGQLPERGAFRRQLQLNGRAPLVLFLGRVSRKKGLDLLLRAFAECSIPAHLAIVGPDTHDGSLEAVQRLRDQLQLGERVTVAGPLYGPEKLQALADADLFVLPSQNENFGNAVAEAVACGVPVLVTESCGIAPFVAGRAGLVVPYDVSALRDALTQFLSNAALREKLRAGCAQVAQSLTWDEPLAEMEGVYRSVTQEAHKA